MNVIELKQVKSKSQLNFFHFGEQFQKNEHSILQYNSKKYFDYTYQPYHIFDLSNIPSDFPNETVLYRYDTELDLFQPFFMYPITKQNDNDINTIQSIMYHYYHYGVLQWKTPEIKNGNKYQNKYTIIPTKKQLLVLFQFI